jgi:hypothetical protein
MNPGSKKETGMEEQRPKTSSAEMETVKQSYASAWTIAFAEVMDIIAQKYRLTLWQEESGRREPTPLLRMWKEALEELSPSQMRKGLLGYMKSERAGFDPSPGELIAYAPKEATDRPRWRIDQDCEICGGSGWEVKKTAHRRHVDREMSVAVRCRCYRLEYAGNAYRPPIPKLPPAPEKSASEILKSVVEHETQKALKPKPPAFAPSEAELERLKRIVREKYGGS